MFHSLVLRNKNTNPIIFFFVKHQESNPLITHLRSIHTSTSKNPSEPIQDRTSSTVSYLINSCGLSPESALSASKVFSFKTPKNPDSVLNFLKSSGFTMTQIANLVAKLPTILASSVEQTIKPKRDCFLAAGLSASQIADLACADPILFRSSLQNRLQPNLEVLSSVIGDTRNMYIAIRRSSRLLSNDLTANFLPNVKTLQSCGVPPAKIAYLATFYPRIVMCPSGEFAKAVDSVKKRFGFDPLSTLFVQGVSVVAGMSPSAWEKKVAVYKSFGWSEEDVVSAFKRYPFIMLLSEEKIRRVTEFFVKEMNWGLSFLVDRPLLLCFSLEKRIFPRCLILSILASKGLVSGELRSITFLRITDKEFVKIYVTKFADQVPEVLKVYGGEMELRGLRAKSLNFVGAS